MHQVTMMNEPRPLNLPVVLGTSRKGRASVHAANLMADLLYRLLDPRVQ